MVTALTSLTEGVHYKVQGNSLVEETVLLIMLCIVSQVAPYSPGSMMELKCCL